MAKATAARFACEHKSRALRRKPFGSDRFRFVYQCLSCGIFLGPQVSAKRAAELGFTPWDEELEKDGREKAAKARELTLLASQQDRVEWLRRYQEHLGSKKWQKIRDLVFRRSDGLCEGCGVRPAVQVHHLTYANLGDEFLWELQAVCMTCHERIHPHMREDAR